MFKTFSARNALVQVSNRQNDNASNKDDLPEDYRLNHIEDISTNEYDSIVFAVAHSSFKEMSPKKIKSFCKENHIIYDLKCIFPSNVTDARL